MKLDKTSYKWAINHLYKESDNDLFPRPYELNIIKELENEVIEKCSKIDIGAYKWHAPRRSLIPKDDLSFRNATQLDIVDSIILGAITYEYGGLIEAKRAAPALKTVFSYRFRPTEDGILYSNKNAWDKFWKSSKEAASKYTHVVVTDIADFYNQIYHHVIENQLTECGFPSEVAKKVMHLITSITQKNSKGIPIGPHCFHLYAEMSLIPLDDALSLIELDFKRYVDDIVIFTNSYKEAKAAFNHVAYHLDKQQRMFPQRSKSKILTSDEFITLCEQNLLEQTAHAGEDDLVQVIDQYSNGDSYTRIKLKDIDAEDLQKLEEINITDLLDSYLKEANPDFAKIRWLYRRLSQIGIPHAIDYSIENFDKLLPALNDVCLYINSCTDNYKSDWKIIGEKVFEILDDELVESNEFYQLSLYNLFVFNTGLNHKKKLFKAFENVNNNIKRKILFASMNYNSASWLSSIKEKFTSFDPWTRRAFLIAASKLPKEEKAFFFKGVKSGSDESNKDFLENIIVSWAQNSK